MVPEAGGVHFRGGIDGRDSSHRGGGHRGSSRSGGAGASNQPSSSCSRCVLEPIQMPVVQPWETPADAVVSVAMLRECAAPSSLWTMSQVLKPNTLLAG